MILVIDNYDSFTFNLVQALRGFAVDVSVLRNDEASVADIVRQRPRGVVISPGPGRPEDAGVTPHLPVALSVDLAGAPIPLLGVCLGHQAIGTAFGGRLVRAPRPRHGMMSRLRHRGSDLFADLPNPLEVGRYHSLVIDRDSLPDDLTVTAETEDGIVMGLAHRRLPIWGVQFHPESILTPHGDRLLRRFVALT